MSGKKKRRKPVSGGRPRTPKPSFLSQIMDHYLALLLLLALVILTLDGVGSRMEVGIVGLILCGAGMLQGEAKVDLWILIPMLGYEVMSAVSSFRTYGDVAAGFASVQAIFPAIYLLMAYLEDGELLWLRRMAALWAVCVALYGLGTFLVQAANDDAGRLGAVMGNPNALGSFLVAGWCAVTVYQPEEAEKGLSAFLLRRAEPVVLCALALTLSMGNFLSLAAAMSVLLLAEARRSGGRAAVSLALRMLSKAALCVGLGILIYFTARYAVQPWLCLVMAVLLLAFAYFWPDFDAFLRRYRWIPPAMTGAGAGVACCAALLRANAVSTFSERFAMMRNAAGYLLDDPLLGVGPYQWRLLNMADGDTYFNTWHIHNVLLHIGVELGLIALAFALAVVVRRIQKGGRNTAGFTAFLLHNLMDTSFFYTGVTSTVLVTSGSPREGGRAVPPVAAKLIFLALAVLFSFGVAFSSWSLLQA